jgi:hypothetical protein
MLINILRKIGYLSGIAVASYLILELLILTSPFFHLTLPMVNKNFVSGFGYFCNSSARFDSLTCFRFTKPFRIIKTANRQLIYDQVVQPNKAGFNSVLQYQFAKSRKRFIVFGDSFTGSIYLDSTWVDKLNSLYPSDSLEYYNFAQDGIGIGNWRHIFFNEVVPQYQFDAVVIAVFGNDLDRARQFMSQDGQYTYMGDIPRYDISSDSFNRLLPKFYKEQNIISNAVADSMISVDLSAKKPFGLNAWFYLKQNGENIVYNHFLSGEMNNFFKTYIYSVNNPAPVLTWQTITNKYGKNLDYMKEILNYCSLHNKEVIICSVPELYGVSINKSGKMTILQRELKVLSEKYGARYFDGYGAFARYGDSTLQQCFLPFDGHFSKTGAQTFAHEFFVFQNSR